MAVDSDSIQEAAEVLVDSGSLIDAANVLSSDNPYAISTMSALHSVASTLVESSSGPGATLGVFGQSLSSRVRLKHLAMGSGMLMTP